MRVTVIVTVEEGVIHASKCVVLRMRHVRQTVPEMCVRRLATMENIPLYGITLGMLAILYGKGREVNIICLLSSNMFDLQQ